MNALTAGKSKDGGFWDRPFSDAKGAWVIRGAGKAGIWACGDNLNELDGSKFETLH